MDRNSCASPVVYESREVEASRKMDVPDFRSPPPGPMASVMQSNGPFEVESNAGEGAVYLPLRTPDHRLLSSGNKSMAEVRKRPLGSCIQSPPAGGDEKRRHVAKVLQFGGEKIPSKAAKCLYGSPSEEDNAKILEPFNEQSLKKFEEFSRRYEIIEEIKRVWIWVKLYLNFIINLYYYTVKFSN